MDSFSINVIVYKNFPSYEQYAILHKTVNFTDVSIIVALFENVQVTLALYEFYCIVLFFEKVFYFFIFLVIQSTGVKVILANV